MLAEEQPRGDVDVRHPIASQQGDLLLLCGQCVARRDGVATSPNAAQIAYWIKKLIESAVKRKQVHEGLRVNGIEIRNVGDLVPSKARKSAE